MSDKNLVARIGQIATKGKHKERFLFVGTAEPADSQDKFFYLIEIDTPWVDGEKIKKTILDAVTPGTKPDDFEATIKKINAALGELSQAGEHEWIGKLNSIIGIISGDELIFSQTGQINGYLFRGNKISHITEKPIEEDEVHPLKTFVSIIDGSVAAGDKIIIANSELYSHFSLDRLRHIFTEFPYKDAIAELSKNLRRSRVRDANLIVFDLFDGEEATDDKPDIIFLDDTPDSTAMRYTKTAIKGFGIGAKATGRGAKKAWQYWSKNIAPKISKRIGNRGQKNTEENFAPKAERYDRSPKVNYFNRKTKRESSGSWLSDASSGVLDFIKSLILPENRKYLYIGIIVVLLLVGFVKIQFNNKNRESVSTANSNLASLEDARNLYAKALDDLGLKKSGAKDELIAARDAASKATGTASIADEANNLLGQINAKLDSLNSATRIASNASSAFDLSSTPVGVVAVGANLFAVAEDGTISQYDTRTKTASNFGQVSADFGKVTSLTYSDNNNSIYLLTDKPDVVRLDIGSKAISELKLVEGATWESSVEIATYSNNIYLLDSKSGQIWKHTAGTATYSAGSAYVSKQPISLKNSTDLAIDGNVYVLGDGGAVIKITRGAEDTSYSVSGVPTPDNKIQGSKKLISSTDINALYVLDGSANRVVVFSKLGSFQKQYVLDGMPLTSFAVNEKLKKLWLISEAKVYEIDL